MNNNNEKPQMLSIPISPHGMAIDTATGEAVDLTAPYRSEQDVKFSRLIEDCNFCIGEAEADAQENESLAHDKPAWQTAHCSGAEFWVNDKGMNGYRVYVMGFAGCDRLIAHVRSKLQNRGWPDVEVAPL